MRILQLSQAEARSSDCVAAIIADPRFSMTRLSDWKRQSKRKDDQGNWVRTFVNRSTNQEAEVIEHSGGIEIRLPGQSASPASTTISNQPQGVQFLPLVRPTGAQLVGNTDADIEWSGRMVFAIEESEEDEVNFTCGPEDTEGGLDDTWDGGAEEKLTVIFAYFPNKILMNAENYHTIFIPPGMTRRQLEQTIASRLRAAGAVPYGSPRRNSGRVAGAGSPQSPIYFHAIPITQENYMEMGAGDQDAIGNYLLCLTTKQHWARERCQIDFIPGWLGIILTELQFPPEDMEATYTADQVLIDRIRADQRFYESPEFGRFMSSAGDRG